MTVKNVVMKSWNTLTEEKVKEEIMCEDPGAWIKLAYVHINLTPPVSQIPIFLILLFWRYLIYLLNIHHKFKI